MFKWHAIYNIILCRFGWSLLAEVDWWDAVGFTQSTVEDGIVSLNSVIVVLDADFHSLPSIHQRQQHGASLDRIKCRLLEGTNAQDVRALVLDMQARLLLDMLGKGIESALINPATLLPEPWQASGEMLAGIDADKMIVEQALVPSIQAYADAVLDLASHFITRLRRYASLCRTLASHNVGASSGSSNTRNMVASPTHSSASPSATQGAPNGVTSTTGSSQMQAWVQGAFAKISSNAEGGSSAPNPVSVPISINTGTFTGIPGVRLIGDCHFLHRLCQLLLFCLIFRRRQAPRLIGSAQKNPTDSLQKGQTVRTGQMVLGTKGVEEGTQGKPMRLGSGNGGQGYTSEEVKVLFLTLVDLCRRTAGLSHALPTSQVGIGNLNIGLHYIDGNYIMVPEDVEASLGPHIQNMLRPRGADAAGRLLSELELQPPSEKWHRQNIFGGPWSDPEDPSGDGESPGLWPRKRMLAERDAAFGLNTSVGLGSYFGIMGSRRDVVTAVWKTGFQGAWYKCVRCLRQTSAFAQPGAGAPANQLEAWWISRWVHCCPMCGGVWVRVV